MSTTIGIMCGISFFLGSLWGMYFFIRYDNKHIEDIERK